MFEKREFVMVVFYQSSNTLNAENIAQKFFLAFMKSCAILVMCTTFSIISFFFATFSTYGKKLLIVNEWEF